MDVLADILTVSGVRATIGANIDAGADWGWWAEPSPTAALHAVTSGVAYLAPVGHEPVQLLPGDVVLLPRGTAHAIASDPEAARRTGPARHDDYELLDTGRIAIGTGPVQTQVLCAHYAHDPAVSLQVLDLLPDVLHLRAAESGGELDAVLGLLGRELTHGDLAGDLVLNRLVDVLLVQILRVWLAGSERTSPCWLAALEDPVAGAAIRRLHADPARDWTTSTLAHEVAVSRATLERRFRTTVGTSPGAYLTRWRMDLAARRLRDTDAPLDAVARSVGYGSVYAFSRAFRRAWDAPPGRFRTEARAAA